MVAENGGLFDGTAHFSEGDDFGRIIEAATEFLLRAGAPGRDQGRAEQRHNGGK
jgi:hypothetical protein